MNSVSVKGDVVKIESDSTHVFVAKDSLFGGPVETGFDGILDFVKELDSLGDINDHVGSSLVGTEAPDLSAVIDVPLVFLGKVSGSGLNVITGSDLFVFNLVRKTVGEGEGFHVETVVLIGRFGKADLAGFL
jgi:hypothetical protein